MHMHHPTGNFYEAPTQRGVYWEACRGATLKHIISLLFDTKVVHASRENVRSAYTSISFVRK